MGQFSVCWLKLIFMKWLYFIKWCLWLALPRKVIILRYLESYDLNLILGELFRYCFNQLNQFYYFILNLIIFLILYWLMVFFISVKFWNLFINTLILYFIVHHFPFLRNPFHELLPETAIFLSILIFIFFLFLKTNLFDLYLHEFNLINFFRQKKFSSQ